MNCYLNFYVVISSFDITLADCGTLRVTTEDSVSDSVSDVFCVCCQNVSKICLPRVADIYHHTVLF